MIGTDQKIAIASDHAGYHLKLIVKQYLSDNGYNVTDFGAYSDTSADYPDFVHPLANSLKEGNQQYGIVLCGSGNGVNMTVNKHSHIRSALCWIPEIAELAVKHNNANVIALPARFVEPDVALKIIDAFTRTEFEGGRHQDRIDKITCSV